MIKIKNGEFKAKGDVLTIATDMACIVHEVFSIFAENGVSKEEIEKTRELVNDAIALALGEKTDEEVFGKMEDSEEDDDIEEDDIEELIGNLFEALAKARK